MAEFQGYFCHPFLLSLLIIEEWVGWTAGWDGMGRGGVGGWGVRSQKPLLGTLHEQQ